LRFLKNNPIIVCLTLLFIAGNAFFIFHDNYFLNAIPIALVIMYIAIFHTATAFLLTTFLTPLSVNLEEFTDGKIGLFLPTEPILFGLLIWMILMQLKKPFLTKSFWLHPITLSITFYLLWMFITSITSSLPMVSFKFLLMKIWYIVPILLLGFLIFKKEKNIERFIWCYAVGMTIAISYTLIRHAGYGFGEEEGHWVMSPLFKDHTIYGAAVSISLFFIIGLLRHKKHALLTQLTLYTLLALTLTGLYFSYTRGAWVSVAFALIVWAFIHYKIKFKYLFFVGITALVIGLSFWSKIEMELNRNKQEHTTTQFDERLKSAANITSDASNLERLNRWHAAWKMFKKRPIFGFGPATYAFQYAPFQNPDDLTIISTNFGNAGNAHSEYLGPLAEMGILGLLAMIGFTAALFYSGITLYINLKRFQPENTSIPTLILFLTLAMSTYFLHGLLNNYLDTDKASIPIYGTAAIFIAQKLKLDKMKKEKRV